MRQDDTEIEARSDMAVQRDVEDLASRVISVLCQRQEQTASGARQYVLDYLIRATLRQENFQPQLVMTELLGMRLTRDELIDVYVPLAACEMGRLWMISQASFSDVTIGALRLQTLLSELSAASLALKAPVPLQLQALIVIPEGEQHFLGAHVVSAQLLRMGVAVTLSFSEAKETLMSRIEHSAPDMVMFSCARVEALETVERAVKTVKSAGIAIPVLALGGALNGDAAGIRNKTGVDLVTSSAKEVVGFCAKRSQALARQ